MIPITMVVITAYIIILFLLSAYFVKRALISYEEYAFCGRQLTLFFIILTYFGTWIGGGTIIGVIGGAYAGDTDPYWIFAMSCFFGYVFALIFLPRIRILNLKSISDFLALRFPDDNEIIRIPSFVAIITRNVTILGMQFAALAYLFTFTFGMDKNISILVTFLIITSYTSLSGLWAVISTDIFQGIFQLIGMILLLYFSIKANGNIENSISFMAIDALESGAELLEYLLPKIDPSTLVVCFGVFFIMGDLVDWERTYSSKSLKVAFWGYLIPLTLTLILLIIPTITGLLLKSQSSTLITGEYITYWFLFEQIPRLTGILILCTIFAAIMSSADSYMIASGTIFANDIIKKFANIEATDREMIFWSRLGVIISGSLGYAFAINMNNILLLWALGIAIATITMLPEYLMAWFSKSMNTHGAFVGMCSGLVYCATIIYSGDGFDSFTIIFGLLLNTCIAYSVRFFSSKPAKDDIESTFYFNERFLNLRKLLKKNN